MKRKEKSLRQMAREIGVSPSYLSQVRHGKRPPSQRVLSSIHKVLSDLGDSVQQNQVDTHPAKSYNTLCAEVAQLVEQRTENPRVLSSILSLGTKEG